MPPDRGILRAAIWTQVFPWLSLFRATTLAADLRKVLLAALAVWLTSAGWWCAGALFKGSSDRRVAAQAAAYQTWPWDWAIPRVSAGEGGGLWSTIWNSASSAADVAFRVPGRLARPFFEMTAARSSWTGRLLASLCAVWELAVWALLAGAMTRIAAIQLAEEQRAGFKSSLQYARRFWASYFGGPLFPLAALVGLGLLLGLAGAVARLEAGFFVVALFWPLALLLAFLTALLAVSLLFGWPLMWGTISCEGTDAFDGLSRSFAYVYQRPFHYAFYALLAALIGIVSWAAVALLAELVLHLSAWGLSWGIDDYQAVGAARVSGLDGITPQSGLGLKMLAFWTGLVRTLVLAYGYSFLWTAGTAMYLLLRHDCDATPVDEVYWDISEEPAGLPELRQDAAGVPVLADEPQPAADEPAETTDDREEEPPGD